MSLKTFVPGLALGATLVGCASSPTRPAPPPASKEESPLVKTAATRQEQADTFLRDYFAELAVREKAANLAYWTAANSGKPEDFDAFAKADIARRLLHNDPARFAQLEQLLQSGGTLAPLTFRALQVAELTFKPEQLPKELTEKMVQSSAEIEQIFASFRPRFEGKASNNNALLEVLGKETNSARREAAWKAYKDVGAQIAPKLIALAKLRNEAARSLGYANYWEMQVRLQEYDPAALLAMFDRLQSLTDAPYKAMKATLDSELGKRFHVAPGALMPWHYDNPFFQSAPPSPKLDLDTFYKGMAKEELVATASRFYADIGLDMASIAARSDLYERDGKNQHAFCTSIDRSGDIRTLLNVKPTEEWMDTMLHEMGHGLYYAGIDPTLPYNLRESFHIFSTEGIAMLFGALAKNPVWLTAYAHADPKTIAGLEKDLLEQRRREQLVFVRWGMVMLRFEKALYENPDQDLDKAWNETVARYQGLQAVSNRHGDWAAKPHFTIAPVYYHNYVLAELFGAQLRHHLAEMAHHTGKTSALSFNGRKDFGAYLTEKVFKSGMSLPWPQAVEAAVGEPLSPERFAAEVR